jgi:hypothetical protein
VWRLTILLIGCGRVGFDTAPSDAVSGDSPAADAAMVSLADHMSCGQPVLLDAGNHLAHDTLVWASTPVGEWLVGVEHESQDVHQIQRHALTAAPSGLAAGTAELMLAVDHVDQMRFEPLPGGGYLLGYTEFVLGTAGTLLVTPEMIGQSNQSLGPLAGGNPALARAGGGSLAMIGINAGFAQVIALGDNGLPSGPTVNVAPPSEGPEMPTLTALDTGLAAVWNSGSMGECRLAILDNGLHITHGPVSMTTSGAACSDAHAAWCWWRPTARTTRSGAACGTRTSCRSRCRQSSRRRRTGSGSSTMATARGSPGSTTARDRRSATAGCRPTARCRR